MTGRWHLLQGDRGRSDNQQRQSAPFRNGAVSRKQNSPTEAAWPKHL